MRRDILWAHQHQHQKRVKQADAPSPGAWSTLMFAKEDPKAFMTQLLPKAMSSEDSDSFEDMVKREERRPIEAYRELLKEAVEASQV